MNKQTGVGDRSDADRVISKKFASKDSTIKLLSAGVCGGDRRSKRLKA